MKVGFIGLGTMGASMALNCRTKGGFEMIVHDLRRDAAGPHLEHGAKWASSAREVAEASDVVFTSLPGPKEVQAVAEELLAGMKKGSAWFDLSTNSPTVVRKLSVRAVVTLEGNLTDVRVMSLHRDLGTGRFEPVPTVCGTGVEPSRKRVELWRAGRRIGQFDCSRLGEQSLDVPFGYAVKADGAVRTMGCARDVFGSYTCDYEGARRTARRV